MSETKQSESHTALVQMTERYEALVRDFGLLGQIESLEDESLSSSEACTRLVALIGQEGLAEYCSIMLLDSEGSYLELRAVATRYSTQGFLLDSDVWKGKRFALNEGIAGQVAATGVQVRINDTLSDPNFLRLPDSPVAIRSLMCFPLMDRGEMLGVLNLSQGEPRYFDVDRERAMSLVAQRMGRLLGRAMRLNTGPLGISAGRDSGLLLLLDGEGRVRQISENCRAVTGLSAGEWTASGHRWRDHVAEEDRLTYERYLEEVSQGLPNDGFAYTFVGADGEERAFTELALPLPAETGISGWLVMVRDEGRKATHQRSANHAASRLLHAQRIHTLGQLAGGLVHDLSGLLAGLVSNLDLALGGTPDGEVADFIARARAAGNRAADMVSKVLSFGRAGTMEGEQVSLDPSVVVRDAAEILKCSLDPRISLEVDAPPSAVRVCADAAQLKQALIHLGMNARDALEPNGAEATSPNGCIKMGVERIQLDQRNPGPWGNTLQGEFVRVYVSDNGAGMSPGVQSRMYEPFYTTKAPGKGTGLGLPTVYRIVRHHRGWIDVHSTQREGSTFNIYLPALPAETTAGMVDEPRETQPPCVLLVDDEALVRNLGAAILKRLGYQVLTAKDGQDGLDTFHANRKHIDLVVLDLQMPGLGGEAVLQQIRAIEPTMPIVYSSGMSYFESEDLPENLRPTGMLKKPYLIATMSEVVQAALAHPR
jgi:signal transduction histidine kinase/CheY-like chemotaxis protein